MSKNIYAEKQARGQWVAFQASYVVSYYYIDFWEKEFFNHFSFFLNFAQKFRLLQSGTAVGGRMTKALVRHICTGVTHSGEDK